MQYDYVADKSNFRSKLPAIEKVMNIRLDWILELMTRSAPVLEKAV